MFWQLFILALFSFNSFSIAAKDSHQREGKLFSLFNVVQFKNDGCRSTSTLSSGGTGSLYRNGTCFTSSECANKGGTKAGSCAAGFGVCCVFLVTESGATINQNCTYIRNPGYPSAYGGTSSVSYTINKCSSNICWLRLDFETFTIQGTGNTIEKPNGGQCLDSFTVSSNTGQSIPVICGQNTGQHMYIDMGAQASDTSTLNFAFSGTSTNRAWEIKATQVPCFSRSAPRSGCLQYHTGLTGRMTTFNFIPTGDNHLMSQNYNVCIRPEAGFCCVQYQVCSDPNSFSLDSGMMADPTMFKAAQETSCTKDYIDLPGSSAACYQGSQNGNSLTNKYCGQFLNPMKEAMANVAICDCTAPFEIGVVTDDKTDVDADADNVNPSRGLCLEWTQIPCSG